MASEINRWKLRQLYFYLTLCCNLRCCHCWINAENESPAQDLGFLDLDNFRHILKQGIAMGLEQVKLTGGEPLLHPGIQDIIKEINDENIGIVVETNGVLCTPEIADLLSRSKKTYVSVSLDGADRSTHDEFRGVPGCFDAAINGIRNLVSKGIRPQIIVSITETNQSRIHDIISLAEQLSAGSVKFNIIQPSGRGSMLHQKFMLPSIPKILEFEEYIRKQLKPMAKLPIIVDIPPAFRPMSEFVNNENGSCRVCSINSVIGVLPDGSYALCGIGELVQELCLGDSRSVGLQDLWENSSVLTEIRTKLPHQLKGVCQRCIMKNLCRGNCIAQNWIATKSLFGPFWFCDIAEKTGYFPENMLLPNP